MNLAVAPQEIGDNQAVYIQDLLLHKPGLLVNRGPIERPTNWHFLAGTTDGAAGIVQAIDPQGVLRVGVLHGIDLLGIIAIYQEGEDPVETHPVFPLPGNPRAIVDSKPMLGGGTLIGMSESYELGGAQKLLLWHGATSDGYLTGHVAATAGSPTITGSSVDWSGDDVMPGMFLTVGTIPYGVVQSVDSSTSLTLDRPAPYTVSGATYELAAYRGFRAKFRTGLLSTNTASTSVAGSGTKFKSQGWNSDVDIFRASDMAYVGRVSSVANDGGLTLGSNAAVAMANEPYVAWNVNASTVTDLTTRSVRETPGFLNCIWDRKQWYANLNHANGGTGDYISRIWASSDGDPEAVDFDPVAGDFIDIPSTKANNGVRALLPALDRLLVLKDNEAHAVAGSTGAYYTTKVSDDGTICGMSAANWNGGAIWAGRDGVYIYDGTQAVNITEDSLGDFYRACLSNFNPNTDRAWGMVYRNHYILHIENVTPPRGIIKGGVETIGDSITFCIYLPNRAVTVLNDFPLRGYVDIASSTRSSAFFLTSTDDTWFVGDASALFNGEGAMGLDVYLETKRFSLGDGMLKKTWRQLAMLYKALNTGLSLDTLVGLNDRAATAATHFLPTTITWDILGRTYASWDALASAAPTWDDVASNTFQPHRIKFMKRAQHLGFRLYQDTHPVSDPTQVVIGPWSLSYKPMPGKI